MSVNIKNPRVEQLLDEVASITGESKTEAMRRALEERRDRLVQGRGVGRPAERLRRVLEREIWPALPASVRVSPLSKQDEDALLGYGPSGA